MNKINSTWQTKPLNSFGIFLRGVSYKKGQLLKEKTLNSVFLLRANNIQEKLDLSDLQIVPKELTEGKIIQDNDIVFAMSSGSKNIVGKNILLKNLQDYSFGAFCGLFRITNKDLNPKFLSYFLKSDLYKLYIINCARGTNINNLRFSDLEKLTIPIPPIETQKQIAERLDFLFDKIDKALKLLNENKEYIKKYRLSILKDAFEGKLTHPSKNWEIKTIEDILSKDKYSIKRGPFGSSLRKRFFVKSGIRVFEQYNPINQDSNWKRYFITQEKFKELEVFKAGAGDLLISCSGTLGKILELPNNVEEGIINQALLKIRLNNKIILNSYFVYLFNSPYMQMIILENTVGSAIKNIAGVSNIKKIKIPIPTIETQKEIVSILDKKFKSMEEIERLNNENIENLLLLKKSLLKEAFSGKMNTK